MNPRPWFWLIFTGIGGRSYFYLGKGEVGESQWISTAEVKSKSFHIHTGAGGEVVEMRGFMGKFRIGA